jgi:hypothetical protein
LVRAAALTDRWSWHVLGLCVHLLLGSANLLFWPSFVQQGLVPVGIVTTALHFVFGAAHALCLRDGAGTPDHA